MWPDVDDVPDLGDHAFLAGELALVGVGVERDLVAHRAAQQLVDRLAERLAADVPQRDVDGAHAFHGGAAAAHVGEAAEQLVPEPLDVRRILAGDDRADLLQHRAQRAVRDLGRRGDLAPAGDALVGGHLDEQELAPVGAAGLDQPRPVTPVIFMCVCFSCCDGMRARRRI